MLVNKVSRNCDDTPSQISKQQGSSKSCDPVNLVLGNTLYLNYLTASLEVEIEHKSEADLAVIA